ncbi:MAG: glycerate kinase type-2 family protein [Sulfolobales archaeon]
MDPENILVEFIKEGLKSADPYEAVTRNLRIDKENIVIKDQYRVKRRKTHVIGFGKSSVGMVKAVVDLLGNDVVGGVVISPDKEFQLGSVEIVKGDHPIPSTNTERASKKLIEYLKNIDKNDLTIILISGGGSALFEVPLPGVDLRDIAEISEMLMKAGADIIELNTVRKHLSMTKGGRLLKLVNSEEIVSLIISDVIGDPISFIASGPTAVDETTYRDAYNILIKRGIWSRIRDNVKEVIIRGMRGEIEESVKPGDPVLNKVKNIIIASNIISLESIEKQALNLGFKVLSLGPYIKGEAREVGKVLASIARSIKILRRPVEPPVVLLGGGETTVTVKGRGIGGRNQEMCLSILIEIKDLPNVYFACIGTDGIDGNSPAAGAIIDHRVYEEAMRRNIDPQDYLDRNDSYTFFKLLNRAIETGPTGVNVGDLYIGLIL